MNVSLRTKLINERVIGKRFGNIAQNYGAIACSMSHLNVLRKFLKSNSSVAIILEDDVIPAQRHDYASAADSMTKMLEIPRKLWNIIYLGFCCKYLFPPCREFCSACNLIKRFSLTFQLLDERCPGVTGRISKEERFSSYCWRNTSRQGAMEGNPLFHQSIQPLCSHALVLDRAMAVIMLRGIYSIVLGYDGLLNIGMCKYGMRSIRAWMPILDQDRKHIRSHIQRVQYPLENFRATVKPRVNGMVTRCKLREYNRTATEALYNRTTPVDRENWFPY
jgi:GR25 family glycosyltransferase involved in LPS biosynthesis